MNKIIVLVILLFPFNCFSQRSDTSAIRLNLQEVIELARNQSPASLQATTRKENRYWQYRSFRSNFNPQLMLSGTLPDFNKDFMEIRTDSGRVEYVDVYNNRSSLRMSLRQQIGLTGGEVSIDSDLRRFDDFRRDDYYYNSNPVSIRFNQPLFNFNRMAWDRKIEPLRFEESKRQFAEELEDISIEVTNRFFSLLVAQINMEIAKKNLANNDTIYKIAEGRYNLGKIAENELLQLRLNVMNSRQAQAQAALDLETSTLRLKTFIGFTDKQKLDLAIPDVVPVFPVNEEKAIAEARKNRQDIITYKRQLLEAQSEVARARGENGLNAELTASYGLTNRAPEIEGVYTQPQDQQRLLIGFNIPVLDWGRAKSRIKTAQANRKLVEYTVAQNEINFDEQVYTQVKTFKMYREQLAITAVADEIADKSYNISKNRYMVGQISITDLNIALRDKDAARRLYITSLRDFWESYYQLRLLTLYDFETDTELLIREEN